MSHFEESANLLALKELCDAGLALIPVNDVKEPIKAFKAIRVLSVVDIIDGIRLEERNGNVLERVAIRVGSVSGGVVCIDVDSKYKQGFSEKIFACLKQYFDSEDGIWDKLRIDKTPSGGLHIYYRISGEVNWSELKSKDLASRYSTEDELELNPKRKTRCFIEFKATEGSLSTTYPSKGYTLIKKGDGVGGIGDLSFEEHLSLTNIVESHNEVIREVKGIKIRNESKDKYEKDKTPFDEFNRSDLAAFVLSDAGWKKGSIYGGLQCWTKPGGIKKVGAGFDKANGLYIIFTTGSSIEKGIYKASTLLCSEKFGGDSTSCFIWLVNQGFGTLKPQHEQRKIGEAVRLGKDVGEIKGVSSEGIKKFEEKKEKYPHGEFWIELDGDKGYDISRELVGRVGFGLGFRSFKDKAVKIEGIWINEVGEREYFDCLKEYIGQPENIKLLDAYEEFLQKSGKFTITRLEPLDESLVLRSTKKISYKFYNNGYLVISKVGAGVGGEIGGEFKSYEGFEWKIWEKYRKDRDFIFSSDEEAKKSLYFSFIQNAIGWSKYVRKCIGFYAHDYRDEESYLINTIEKCEDPKDGGGSGKNVFWKLFSLTTTFKSTAASMIKKDNQFLQSWNGEKIFVLADLPKDFDLIFFKDMVTDGAVVRKLYKDEYNVDVHDMAKLGLSGNYSFDDSDPGIKRRLRIIEFTDFYTKNGGVKEVHDGKMFPKDWEKCEFEYFDNIMALCIQEYLEGDSIIDKNEISDTGWAKKQEQNYKHLYNFIKENIDDWVSYGRVSNDYFNSCYFKFRNDSNIQKALSAFTINKALSEYCFHFGICFVHSYKKPNGEISTGVAWKESEKTVKGRLFGIAAEKFLGRNPEIELIKSEEVKEDLPF